MGSVESINWVTTPRVDAFAIPSTGSINRDDYDGGENILAEKTSEVIPDKIDIHYSLTISRCIIFHNRIITLLSPSIML